METNFFGALKLTQALLPHFRARKSGDFVFVGSYSGLKGNMAVSAYSASKFALESLHDSLRMEGASFGIRSLIFEPGICRTEVFKTYKGKTGNLQRTTVEELAPVRSFMDKLEDAITGNEVGDPKKVVSIIVDMVKGEGVAQGREIPDRLPLGTDALTAVKPKHETMLEQWRDWKDVITSIDLDDVIEKGDPPEYVKMMAAAF